MDIAHISNLALVGQEEDGDCTLTTTAVGNNFAAQQTAKEKAI